MRTVILLLLSSSGFAAEFVVGEPGAPIEGMVSADASLTTAPTRGTLDPALGSDGIATDGSFRYLPDPGFEGMDDFVYTMDGPDGLEDVQVRILSGRVELLPAVYPQVALAVPRTGLAPTRYQRRGNARQLWNPIDLGDGGIQFESDLRPGDVLQHFGPNPPVDNSYVAPNTGDDWQIIELVDRSDGYLTLNTRSEGLVLSTDVARRTSIASVPVGEETEGWLVVGAGQTPAPAARADTIVVPHGERIDGNVLDNDVANSVDFFATLVSGPSHGELVGIGALIYTGITPWGQFEYQPDADFSGIDTLTYIARGSSNGAPSRLVTVTLDVQPASPISHHDLVLTSPNTQVEGNVLANDEAVGDPLAYLVSPPRYGSLVGIPQSVYGGVAPWGQFVYEPDPDFEGVDAFAYRFLDGGVSRISTVFIVVGDVRIGSADNWRSVLDVASDTNRTPFTLEALGDAQRQGFTLSDASDPGLYQLGIQGSSLETWMPQAAGTDATLYTSNSRSWQEFSLTFDDDDGLLRIESAYTGRELGVADSAVGTPVGTYPPNDDTRQRWLLAGLNQSFGPAAVDDAYTTTAGTVVQGDVLINDQANGFDIASLMVVPPEHGQLVGIGESVYGGITPWGQFDYQPTPGFTGVDEFVYLAITGSGAPSRYVTVTIDVRP